MTTKYDLAIVGTGTAASVTANRCRAAGWRVAVIDYLPFGGTCALRGCDPKKVLVGAAQAIDHVARMHDKGIHVEKPSIAWQELISFKRSFTDPVPAMKEKNFASNGIDFYHGSAEFCGPNTLSVGNERLEARFIVLAAGAVPKPLNIPGAEHVIDSTRFLELEQLPKRIAFLGGGYIAAEFAHIVARAGAKATILQRRDRLLPRFDAEVVGWMMKKFGQVGIDVRLNMNVTRIERKGGEVSVAVTSGGKDEVLSFDLVVHAAGRRPDLDRLKVDAAGIAVEHGQITLNEYLQSVSNPAIYAAGDFASSGPPLTPVASHDAKVVAENMLNGNRRTPNYEGVPSVVFTIPPLASVGLTEYGARERNLKFRMQHRDADEWYTARHVGETVYGFKVLVEDDTDRILGAHLVGPGVDEVINVFALAIRQGITAKALKSTVFAYPTGASDIGYML
ncbi:dihydrolipoyl dehydrogenase family protein [Paraburkholderia fungorum]|uniref:Glutathione reductase (NADPH) n=2 Tax=Paraburkholderia TaxID=1822464 RepID=A0AAW3UZY7_9BURK|nr:NAD(P)/FAD-dependent oxidoreductase [Paraburkholderia fungorum]MBB4518633.1 glutathione reductase (NADPH) [Paraburkholderia fungorum]MBB6204118.1 glutathione reductase (NADPH) [Paraburkholderia fungorum]